MTGRAPGRIQRAIGSFYSWAAEGIYEPVVIKGGFRLFGGQINQLVAAQGRRAVEAARGGPILDAPVGTAYFTIRLAASHPGVIVGADYAFGMVRETSRAARRHASNILPVQADIHSLPFADDAFRSVMCTNGLQVIPDLNGALFELTRVLGVRGALFLSVIVAPISTALPRTAQRRLPTALRSGESIAGEMTRVGLTVLSIRRERFAFLIEATKI